MIKVVYFDDDSVTDYLCIYNGGTKVQTADKIKEKSAEIAANATIGIHSKLSWLPFFGTDIAASTESALAGKSDSLVKTTLSNTVLTDFLEKVRDNEERILKFNDCHLTAYKNSMAFFKMFTPYLIMTKGNLSSDELEIDISKMDLALESGKGYYEMISTDKASKEMVFRFNIKAFRNNYGIADLTKMNLVYYGVKVGKVDISMLDISNEFNGETKVNDISAYGIEQQKVADDKVDVYDILLAGVEL